jgi:hypothetical protein
MTADRRAGTSSVTTCAAPCRSPSPAPTDDAEGDGLTFEGYAAVWDQ